MGDNAAALEETLGELRRMGRLEPVDAAHVQALKSMAATLDEKPSDARLWGQYRAALDDLVRADDDDDDDLAAALAKIRSEAEVVDS